MPRDANCTKCSLHESSQHVCIWGQGEGEGFLIGEAPGRNEARTGKPFTGEAGQVMRPIMRELGLDDPYVTNVAKCRPPENRKPEPSEIAACKPYLLEEIETRKPKAILLLGAVAMKATIGRAGITEMNGQVVEKNGQTYVCCFHPAYILRDPSKMPAMRMAMTRYAAVLSGTHSDKLPEWRAIDADSFDDFVANWTDATDVTFDIETAGENDGEGLAYYKDTLEITSIAFTLTSPDGVKITWALALDHPSAVLPVELRKELIVELTRSTAGKVVKAQNGKFDNMCLLRRFGVRFHLNRDTILAHHLIDENSSHELKTLARQYLGAPDYDLSTKEKQNTRLVPVRRLLGYNGADSFYTDGLDPIFAKKMDEQEEWLYRKVIMPAARHFERIDSNGLYVDIDFLNKAEANTRKLRQESLVKLNKMAGREINWNSPSQVAEILYGDLKLTPTVLTDGGNPSTGEEALIDLDHPIAKLLEEYRGHSKFLSTYTGELIDGTYVGGWRDLMEGAYFYPSTKMIGTVTGRYSSRLHQTPRDGVIRNAVTAPPGWKFGQLDLSQAELRVIAITSRDAEMLSCFKHKIDIHWRTLIEAVKSGGGEYVDLVMATAKRLTKRKMNFEQAIEFVYEYGKHDPDKAVQIAKEWKEARKKAKGINFGFAFGQSARGFITYAKTKYGFEPTLHEATQFRETYFNLYHGLPAWHERQIKLVKLDGFVRSMSGRKRRLPGITSSDKSVRAECERQAINSPIQGFIGDYKAMILVQLCDELPWDIFRTVGEVHDSILFWYKDESILPTVHAIASRPRLAKEAGLNFPIEMAVDIELGRWGAGSRWRSQ